MWYVGNGKETGEPELDTEGTSAEIGSSEK